MTTVLYHTLDRKRWFLVPADTRVAVGQLRVRRFAGPVLGVDEAIVTHEVDEAAAQQWINARPRASSGSIWSVIRELLGIDRQPRRGRRAAQRRAAQPRKLARVGFFAELRHGDPAGVKLADVRDAKARPDETQIVAYLKGAPVLFAAVGPVRDVLDPDAGYIGAPSIHTDGTWAWPADLAHYVERYHVTLPKLFLAHIRSRRFQHVAFDVASVRF